MITFENLYDKKDDASFVWAHLERYLIAEIYSPTVIRLGHSQWNEMPFYAREAVHLEIRELMEQSSKLSNPQIQNKINAHLITRAIKTLVAYSHCSVPLTQDKSIPVRHENFLSDRGKWALKALLKTAVSGKFYSDMADLAVRTSHKFLMDLGYYRDLIRTGAADVLTFSVHNKKTGYNRYFAPVVQLVQGCPNHCSHCFASAEAHLSYMPYPMWRKIYETLDSRYQYYHGYRFEYGRSNWISRILGISKKVTYDYANFDRFFHDSDPSTYRDSVMNIDAGDVALFLRDRGAEFYFLTKGVTDSVSRRAIAKTALAYPIDISFVDTPAENKVHGVKQFKKTLELIQSVPNNQGIPRIWHTHLKSGPTVPESFFQGIPVIKTVIKPSGRANQFAVEELDMDFKDDGYPFAINPNGDVVLPRCENTRYVQEKLNNIFLKKRERE